MMDLVNEIEIAQVNINNILSELIKKAQKYEKSLEESNYQIDKIVVSYETTYPLTSNTSIFKGKKPTGVFFKNGIRHDIGTWKKVFELILKDCVSDKEKRDILLNLRGKISGRERVLLSSTSISMRRPLEIDKNLFVESHYDTESLLRILTTRILEPVGYDYSNIKIAIRNN